MFRIAANLVLLLLTWFSSSAQESSKTYKLHSHNDYLQTVPFWEAYANGMESIEADVILMDNGLYVAHEKESIKKERTLISLYLEPIRKAFELNFDGPKKFQLLIDIKTEPYSTLKRLEELLLGYKDILKTDNDTPKMTIVISGNRPTPRDYGNYPDFIKFDYQSILDTTGLPLEKIDLISLNFRKFSKWNGKGRMMDKDREALVHAINVAHSLNKPIRFWATPDSKTAWKALRDLGVDFINTDHPYKAKTYMKGLDK